MEHLLIAATLAGSAATLLPAQLAAQDMPAPAYSDQQIIENFEMPLIAAIAEANGYVLVEDPENAPSITIQNVHGEQAVLGARTCEDEARERNCTGLVIARLFADGATLDPANIALAGREFLSLKLYLDENSALVAERYVITDGGVTMKHVALNIDLVFDAWQVVRPYVTGEETLE